MCTKRDVHRRILNTDLTANTTYFNFQYSQCVRILDITSYHGALGTEKEVGQCAPKYLVNASFKLLGICLVNPADSLE